MCSFHQILAGFCARQWLLLIGSVLIVSACSEQSQTEKLLPPEVSVAQPLIKVVTDWDEFTGRLVAVETVEVRARVSGYLESVHFKEGTLVNKGDLLYNIDPRPYQAVLDAAQAEQARAEASLELAINDLKRAQRLYKSKTVAEEELDTRTQQRRKSAAELDIAKAAVRAAALNVEFTHVYSPIAGQIGKTEVTPGNLISGGESDATILTTIVSLDPIHIYISADEQEYLRYLRLDRAGKRPLSRNVPNPIYLKLADEDDFIHEGYMDFVDNRIDENTGTMRGRGVFPNPDFILVPGMFAELKLIGVGPYDSLLIPDEAIGFDQATQFVFIVDADNVVHRRNIITGRLIDGLRIVREGLTQEDRIIIKGLQRARAGETVRPQESRIQAEAKAANSQSPS